MFKKVDYLQNVDSTNEYLKSFVEERLPRAVLAFSQESGKGRYGKTWVSRPGEGVYASYLLFPKLSLQSCQLLNMVASLGVMETIREFGLTSDRLQLKVPNDVLIGRRKVSGILVELGSLRSCISWAIVGIGVNLFQREFPAEIQKTATSLELEGVRVGEIKDFFESLTRHFVDYYELAMEGQGSFIKDQYERELV